MATVVINPEVNSIIINTPEKERFYDQLLTDEMKLTSEIINNGIDINDDGLITTPSYIRNQQSIIQIINALSAWRQTTVYRKFMIRKEIDELYLLLSTLQENLHVDKS